MENSNIILDKLTAIESLLEATHLDKLTAKPTRSNPGL